MANIELHLYTTVDFKLYEAFADFIYKHAPKDEQERRSSHQEYIQSILGLGTDHRGYTTRVSRARRIKRPRTNDFVFTIPVNGYLNFCEKFNAAFKKLDSAKQDEYRDLNSAFENWKFNLDSKHGIIDESAHEQAKPTVVKNPEEGTGLSKVANFEIHQENDLNVQYKNKKSENSFSEFKHTFENSKWFCYMMFGDGLLGRQTIEFKSFNERDECEITINHFLKNLPVFQGKAIFSSEDRTLILTTTSYEKGKSSNYYKDYSCRHYKVDNTLEGLELCIGHITFRHKTFNNIVSLVTIITKCKDDEEDFSVKKFKLEDDDEGVNSSIRRFYKQIKINRIETPRSMGIYDFDTLDLFLRNSEK